MMSINEDEMERWTRMNGQLKFSESRLVSDHVKVSMSEKQRQVNNGLIKVNTSLPDIQKRL
jgi:hypothetical protein